MTEPADPPVANAEPTIRDRYLVAAYLLQRYALKNEALDRGHRGEVEALIADGPLDVDLYNQLWSSRPGVFGRNLERAREWLRSWLDARPSPEPAPNPLTTLFGGADPRLIDAIDAGAAAVAIECAAVQLALALAGGPSAGDDAAPRVVRIRDAAVALVRSAVLAAHAMGAAERPQATAAAEGLATPPTSAPVVVGNEGFGRCPFCDARDTKPIEVGARLCFACGGAYWVTCVGGVGSQPPAAASEPAAPGTGATRWMIAPQRRALLVDWLAARHPQIPKEERGTLIDVVLASVTAAPTMRDAPAASPAAGARYGWWAMARRRRAVLIDWLAAQHPRIPGEGSVEHLLGAAVDLLRGEACGAPSAPETATAPTAAGTPEERYKRALDAEAFAERAYRAAREATDTARDALLSARARAISAGPADEEQLLRRLFRERAAQLGLDGAEVSR